MFINKYVLIPILITCVWVVALVVAGVPAEVIYQLIPILLLGHFFGYMLGVKHVKPDNNG